jgi:hypothetical protein
MVVIDNYAQRRSDFEDANTTVRYYNIKSATTYVKLSLCLLAMEEIRRPKNIMNFCIYKEISSSIRNAKATSC